MRQAGDTLFYEPGFRLCRRAGPELPKIKAMPSPLSAMQTAFVDAYEGNATEAARKAGYRDSSARQSAARLMSKAAIRDAIAARQARDSQQLQIERLDVIKGLLEAIAEAKAQANPAAMISGWATVAKLLGLYAPQQHQVAIVAPDVSAAQGRYERMTDAELLAMINGPAWGPSGFLCVRRLGELAVG
jgi:phage terminase small subunit